jgi:hypothetical protein
VFSALADLARYVDDGIVQLARRFGPPHLLAQEIQTWVNEITALREGEALDLRPRRQSPNSQMIKC